MKQKKKKEKKIYEGGRIKEKKKKKHVKEQVEYNVGKVEGKKGRS